MALTIRKIAMSKIENYKTDWRSDTFFSTQNVIHCSDKKWNAFLNSIGGTFANDYYGPILTSFSFCLKSKKSEFNKRPIILRDGLVPLLWSLEHSSPSIVTEKLLVHYELANWIPQKWRDQIDFYCIQSKVDTSTKAFKQVLIIFKCTYDFSDLAHLESKIKEAKKLLKANKDIKIFILSPAPSGAQNDLGHNPLPITFGVLLQKHFKDRFEIINEKKLFEMKDLSQFKVFEINSKLFISDTFVINHVLSRGATLLADKNLANLEISEKIALSPFHELVLLCRQKKHTSLNKPKSSKDIAWFKVAGLFKTTTKIYNLWPIDFVLYCRHLLDEKNNDY